MPYVDYVGALAGQFANVMGILAFRAIPIVAYVLVSRRHGVAAKCCALLLGYLPVAVSWALLDIEVVLYGLGAVAYFTGASALVHFASTQQDWLRFPIAVFTALVLVFLLIPSLFVPTSLLTVVIVLGWEMLLSSYSYAVDRARIAPSSGYRQALFFIMVDPTLVYAQRSETLAPEVSRLPGLVRVAVGVSAMMVHDALRLAYQHGILPGIVQLDQISSVRNGVAFATYHVIRGFALYLTHSGLASMQIGMMRLAGFATPERYVLPFLALNPQDFWRRFNTWVGAWVRRHLYMPFALWFGRTFRDMPLALTKACALLLAFATVGVLHDLPEWITAGEFAGNNPRSAFSYTFLFLILGGIFVAWIALENLLRSIAARLASRRALLRAGFKWLAFQQVLLLIVWVGLPVIETGQLPRELARWF